MDIPFVVLMLLLFGLNYDPTKAGAHPFAV